MHPYFCLNDIRSFGAPNPPRHSTIAARGPNGNYGGTKGDACVVGAQRPISVRDLAQFPEGSTVGPDEFEITGVLRGKTGPVKVLGLGELPVKLTVRAHKFSAGAREKIEAAGGSVETIE